MRFLAFGGGYQPGSVSNTISASTIFTWDSSQVGSMVNLSFTPNSVCGTPAYLLVDIARTCPIVLSKEARIGIAVGATLGGLILIAAGVLAAIWLYRVWNRRLV
jgi:hypothetical protein